MRFRLQPCFGPPRQSAVRPKEGGCKRLFSPADSAFAETAGRRFAAAMPSIVVSKDRPSDQPMK